MPTSATWPRGGRSLRIPSAESRWQLKIFSQKPAARFGSSLDGDPVQNNAGFLVRDGLPHPTIEAHTALARPPASMSH